MKTHRFQSNVGEGWELRQKKEETFAAKRFYSFLLSVNVYEISQKAQFLRGNGQKVPFLLSSNSAQNHQRFFLKGGVQFRGSKKTHFFNSKKHRKSKIRFLKSPFWGRQVSEVRKCFHLGKKWCVHTLFTNYFEKISEETPRLWH